VKTIRVLAISVLFAFLSNILFGQCEYRNIKAYEINTLDSFFKKILHRHNEILSLRNVRIIERRIIVVTILPILNVADGIPIEIIDSIYKKCEFPLKDDSPAFDLIIESLPYNASSLNSIDLYPYKYYYRLFEDDVLFISKLPIKFPTNFDEHILVVGDNSDKSKESLYSNNFTLFRMRWYEILEIA